MIRVQKEPFDVGAEYAAAVEGNATSGGVAMFVGRMRGLSDGRRVDRMTLEYYPGMAEKELERIVQEARDRWPVEDCRVIHRYGEFLPGDVIVLVIVLSAHREAAFSACGFVVDWLKTRAPFWKLESGEDGERWIEAGTGG